MFTPDFSLQSKILQSMTDLAVSNIASSVKFATEITNASMQAVNKIAEQSATGKSVKSSPTGFPMPFNYFPNLFKTEEKVQFPFSPMNMFDMFQDKEKTNLPFPMTSFSSLPSPSPFSGAFLTPFSMFSNLQPIFEQFQNAQGNQSIKGFMMFFEIPLDKFKTQQFPWMTFPKIGLN